MPVNEEGLAVIGEEIQVKEADGQASWSAAEIGAWIFVCSATFAATIAFARWIGMG